MLTASEPPDCPCFLSFWSHGHMARIWLLFEFVWSIVPFSGVLQWLVHWSCWLSCEASPWAFPAPPPFALFFLVHSFKWGLRPANLCWVWSQPGLHSSKKEEEEETLFQGKNYHLGPVEFFVPTSHPCAPGLSTWIFSWVFLVGLLLFSFFGYIAMQPCLVSNSDIIPQSECWYCRCVTIPNNLTCNYWFFSKIWYISRILGSDGYHRYSISEFSSLFFRFSPPSPPQ